MKDSNGYEISKDAEKLIVKRNSLVELFNSVHDQSNKYLIGKRIQAIDTTLSDVYGLI
ncbi:MAG: hypothetical protein A4E23_01257 [Methanomethylovorans sp. PtaU1.Bin073]|nr:MAG: hypothetical protein A4E23_01257 [Methanomethylovorans sp. PtaU1.Bin073]